MDLQFGQHRLKRAERQLLGPEGLVELSARSFDILALLLAKPDEVIGKSEIFDAVCPGLGGRGEYVTGRLPRISLSYYFPMVRITGSNSSGMIIGRDN